MIIEAGSKLVMIGDSVTDCGRSRPVGEGLFDAVGSGYVSYIHGFVNSVFPERKIRVVNMGVFGDTVRELKKRWTMDVLDLKPDWVSIMIGINDVWQQFNQPLQTELHVSQKEYAETLEQLVKDTLPRVKGLILMTPYYIEPNKNDAMRKSMDEYGAAVRAVAEKFKTVFVDTQAAFDEILKHCNPNFIALDRVHPNNIGHMALARVLIKTLGLQLID